jgi:site-specific DNA recombinase
MGHDKDYFARLVRLGYLAPDIISISAIVDGRQPVTLTRQRLARVSKLPFDWTAQRALLGFTSA